MEFVNCIIQGLVTGIIVSMSFGAGFFSMIQTSLNRGLRKSLLISAGVVASDLLFILMAVFGSSFLSEYLMLYAQYIRFGGMVLLIIIGIYSIIHSVKIVQTQVEDDPHTLYYLSKGFLINTFNPLALITWLAISVFIQTLNYTDLQIFIYFLAVIVSLAGTQFFICFMARVIKQWLSEKMIHRFNIGMGIIIIGLGLLLYFGNQEAAQEKASEQAKKFLEKK